MSNKEKESDSFFIKKNYGEEFWHFCKISFPTILNSSGKLRSIISSHFRPSRYLYQDLVKSKKLDEFVQYINGFDNESEIFKKLPTVEKSPEELMLEAGYILYPECLTYEEISKFKKFYQPRCRDLMHF